LAAIVTAPIAAGLLEVNRSVHAPGVIVGNRITGLVRPVGNAELLSAELDHFRHERQRVELAFLVESCQDLSCAADLDQFTRAQIQTLL
jgi:hypothetical protein